MNNDANDILKELYGGDDVDVPVIDPIECVDIDVDAFNNDALQYASTQIDNLLDIYTNKDLMQTQPQLKRKIDTRINEIAQFIMMKNSDKFAHDMILRGIGRAPDNDRLYARLLKIQETSIKIQNQIDDMILKLKTELKNIQLELPLNVNEDEQTSSSNEEQESFARSRGAKDFIERMKLLKKEQELKNE